MTRAFVYDGAAMKTVNPLDPWGDWPGDESDDALTASKARDAVSCYYRCVMLRANAVSAMPFVLKRGDRAVDNLPLEKQIKRLLWKTEASLSMHGAAYWLRGVNRAKLPGYRWFAVSSMEYVSDAEAGLTGFKRRVGTKVYEFTLDEIVYFWLPDSEKEVGPGRSPGDVALKAAGVSAGIDAFATAFFERGAITATLLVVDGNPPRDELDRLERWWKKLLRGVRKAWETIAIRANVKPQKIGVDPKELAMPDLDDMARRKMALAFGVPVTLLEDAANFATSREHRKSFYEETVIPECGVIADIWNEQEGTRLGLTLEFQPEQLDVMQEDEAARAASLKALVDAGVPLRAAMLILGYDLPDEVVALLDAEEQRKEEARERMAALPASQPPQLQAPQQAQPSNGNGNGAQPPPPNAKAAEDLEKWERKALRAVRAGKGAAVEFDSDTLDAELIDTIRAALSQAQNEPDVRYIFHLHAKSSVPLDATERGDFAALAAQFGRAAEVIAQAEATG